MSEAESPRRSLYSSAFETLILTLGETVTLFPATVTDEETGDDVTAVVEVDDPIRNDTNGDSHEERVSLMLDLDTTVDGVSVLADPNAVLRLQYQGKTWYAHTIEEDPNGFAFLEFARQPREYYSGGFDR